MSDNSGKKRKSASTAPGEHTARKRPKKSTDKPLSVSPDDKNSSASTELSASREERQRSAIEPIQDLEIGQFPKPASDHKENGSSTVQDSAAMPKSQWPGKESSNVSGNMPHDDPPNANRSKRYTTNGLVKTAKLKDSTSEEVQNGKMNLSKYRKVDEASKDARDAQIVPERQKAWYLSRPYAGRYVACDPIFVQDENGQDCLISATNQEVQLISLETSLIVRTHVISSGKSIACYCLSAQDRSVIEMVYDNGVTELWNFITSDVLPSNRPSNNMVLAMAVGSSQSQEPDAFDIRRIDEEFSISKNGHEIYSTPHILNTIQTAADGVYLVALGPRSLVLGKNKDPNDVASTYSWTEIPAVRNSYTCMDVRAVPQQGKSKKDPRSQRQGLTLAVGNTEGQVHLYSDLSTIFGPHKNLQFPAPRILHWHRESVSAIKFSKDGNYLLSGGKETVLVLWQLETGKQQFLPHLTAEIERITVSPDGSKYALQMGDNSLIVLSTSELSPIAYVAGIQLPVRTVLGQGHELPLPKSSVAINPQNPHKLLLTVPSSQPKMPKDISVRPFLQTFDLRACRHINRQALARNNVTDFNRGPEQTAVVPPDVCFLAISEDGQWLATVDEWMPPASDLEHAVSRPTGLKQRELAEIFDQQERAKEVYLKFWNWNNAQETWTLSTRVDAPHARATHASHGSGAGNVLKLVADPSQTGFATIGEDCQIKIWRPKGRNRNGNAAQVWSDLDTVSWVCKHSVAIPAAIELDERFDSPMDGFLERKPPSVLDAALAFSEDGSVLACCTSLQYPESRPSVHFISPSTGTITTSKTNLLASEQRPLDIGFLNRFFVALSDSTIRVWNLINDSHHYSINFPPANTDMGDPLLAIQHDSGLFAVVGSKALGAGGSNHAPRVQVYNIQGTQLVFEEEFAVSPVAILASKTDKGFILLFDDGTIRKLAPGTPGTPWGERLTSIDQEEPSALLPIVETSSTSPAGLGNQLSASKRLDIPETPSLSADATRGTAADDDEDGRPVVRSEQLAAIFDVGHSYAMPPVRDMFREVAELYGRKPHSYQSNQVSAEN